MINKEKLGAVAFTETIMKSMIRNFLPAPLNQLLGVILDCKDERDLQNHFSEIMKYAEMTRETMDQLAAGLIPIAIAAENEVYTVTLIRLITEEAIPDKDKAYYKELIKSSFDCDVPYSIEIEGTEIWMELEHADGDAAKNHVKKIRKLLSQDQIDVKSATFY